MDVVCKRCHQKVFEIGLADYWDTLIYVMVTNPPNRVCRPISGATNTKAIEIVEGKNTEKGQTK